MKWLTSNLLILVIVGGLLFFGSFVRGRLWVVKPNWIIFGIGAALMVAVVVGVLLVIQNPPGPDIVDEEEHDGSPQDIPKTALERLRLKWYSDAVANWPAAETLADISEIAYEPPVEAERRFHALGFSKVMPVVQGSMIGYVITGEDVTVVAFRGTDFNEVSDWIANLGRSATNTPHGQIHRGFYNAYQSMKWQVDTVLKERDTTHLWVTGHSLGGALALVCAYDLAEVEQRHLDGIITFGQPMVARQQFADYLDTLLVGRYARFVNRDDIVPKVPPSHVACGSLVWFTNEGVKRSKVKQVLYSTADPYEVPTSADDEAEIKPFTESEFKALQTRLKMESADNDRIRDLPRTMEYRGEEEEAELFRDNNAATEYMAAPSLIDDHSMWLYLDKVRTLLGLKPTEEPR